MADPALDSFGKLSDVAFDVGLILGSTTAQGLAKSARLVNRAMRDIAGHDRRWSWLKGTDSFNTVAGQNEYSLPLYVRKEHLFWIPNNSRQKLDRIPERRFRELSPNPILAQGIPRLYGFEGVDSQGCIIISLYPVPNVILEVDYTFARRIVSIPDASMEITPFWGVPDDMYECLVNKAAALGMDGIDDERVTQFRMKAEQDVLDAYAADQSHPDTTYRAPMNGVDDLLSEGPMLPAEFGYGGN